jgi:lipoyl(octanoyl) transferase
MISVVQLGTIDYATGLRLQQTLVDLRKQDRISDTLLLLEHRPVITLGRNADESNIVVSREFLERKGVEVFECDRGGDVTFHGPGQLVGYPIFDLRAQTGPDGQRKTVGAVEYIRRVEEALIRTCADYGIATERLKGMTGVWTSEEQVVDHGLCGENQNLCGDGAVPRPEVGSAGQSGTRQSPVPSKESSPSAHSAKGHKQSKIAAIGVHISRAVTSHGFALNVNTDLDYFKLIIPCGISSKPVTSIQKELAREVPLDEVAQSVARNFGRVFSSQILWLETLDALMGRTVGIPNRAPEELRRLHGDDISLA